MTEMGLDRLDERCLVVALDVLRQAVAAAIFWRRLELSLNDFRQRGTRHCNDCGSSSSCSGGTEEEPPTGRFGLAVLHFFSAKRVGNLIHKIVRHKNVDSIVKTLNCAVNQKRRGNFIFLTRVYIANV